jgi:hypothetical protein
MLIVEGGDELNVDRRVHRLDGDLTVLTDGRVVLMAGDAEVHDLGDVLAALVDEPADALGDPHVGRVRLTVEVLDRHERLSGPAGRRRTRRRPVGHLRSHVPLGARRLVRHRRVGGELAADRVTGVR